MGGGNKFFNKKVMEGWIKLHRKMVDNSLYPKNRPFTQFEAWLDLLIIVNHSDVEIILGNEIYHCKRGQSIRSNDTYQKRWNWSRQQVRSFLNLLEKLLMIEQKTTTKTTILTICNYETYQGEQPTDNQRITINKNEKKEKNEKNENKYFIAPTISEIQEYCLERKNNVIPELFFSHYESNGWMVGKTKMKSWKGAVRTWELNGINNNSKQPEKKEEPKLDPRFKIHGL